MNIFSQGYDEVSSQMDYNTFCVNCWLLFQISAQKVPIETACRGLPKEFLWLKRKIRWSPFHIALETALNHNKKIDDGCLKSYSHSILPIRNGLSKTVLTKV